MKVWEEVKIVSLFLILIINCIVPEDLQEKLKSGNIDIT